MAINYISGVLLLETVWSQSAGNARERFVCKENFGQGTLASCETGDGVFDGSSSAVALWNSCFS